MATVNKKTDKAPSKKPAWKIYQEIIQVQQQANEPTETFVAKKRALFAQLSPPNDEETQLDMIYGILHEKIKEEVPRKTVLTFEGLLEAAKCVKQFMNPPVKKKRKRCNFCRNHGHLAEVCRKKPEVRAIPAVPDFALDIRPRPTIIIEIDNIKDIGFVDTGATICVASYKLYTSLKALGYKFEEKRETITLAIGGPQERDIFTVKCVVNLCGRSIPTEFLIFPEARKTITLLGVKFLVDAGMVLSLAQLTWHFVDDPTKIYDLIEEEEETVDGLPQIVLPHVMP